MSTTTLTTASAAAATHPVTARRLSGFKPTGRLHLGNYLGAIRPMVGRPARPATRS